MDEEPDKILIKVSYKEFAIIAYIVFVKMYNLLLNFCLSIMQFEKFTRPRASYTSITC